MAKYSIWPPVCPWSLMSLCITSPYRTSIGVDLKCHPVTGELVSRRQQNTIGTEHIVREMGQDGTDRLQRRCRCNRLCDVKVKRVRIPAQTVDHQHLKSFQQGP